MTALLIGFVVSLNARIMRSLPRRRYISLTLVFFMAGFVVFWLLWKVLGIEWNGLSIVYWLWSDVFISTAVIQFWISVNDALHPHQAKRLVGFFVSGGLLGGLGGALLAWRLARVIGTENLLLFCPAVLVLTLIVARRVHRDREGEGERTPDARPGLSGYWEGFHAIRGHRYLRLLAGLLSAGAVAGTLIELQFNTILGWHFRSADPRTAFLGSFFAVLLAVSWFVQMFGTSRLLKRFGIRGGLLAAPLLLLAGSASIFLFSTPGLIVWAVIVKGMDKSLENTLNQSARELLYIPVPADVKDKAKIFIDMFLNKFSTALGAVLFFGFYTALRLDIEVISVVTVAFLALAIVLAAVIFGEYIQTVKKDLARKWEDGEKIVAAHVDMDSARLVFDTLQSRDRSSELYVMNLYDLIRKDRMTPELKEILAGLSGEARARSMDSLLDVGGETFFSGMEDALADKELGTEINEVFELDSYRKVMGDHLEKLTGGGSESEVGRMEAAKVLGMMKPDSGVVTQLSRLLGDPSSEVLNYALASAARLRRKEHIPLVIRQLGNPQTSRVARDALVVYGETILGTLRRRLEDSRGPLPVRKAIPEVLALLGTQRSADVLIAALQEGREATEAEVIEALYRIRAENPGRPFQGKKDPAFRHAARSQESSPARRRRTRGRRGLSGHGAETHLRPAEPHLPLRGHRQSLSEHLPGNPEGHRLLAGAPGQRRAEGLDGIPGPADRGPPAGESDRDGAGNSSKAWAGKNSAAGLERGIFPRIQWEKANAWRSFTSIRKTGNLTRSRWPGSGRPSAGPPTISFPCPTNSARAGTP